MTVTVRVQDGGEHRLVGDWPSVDLGKEFLGHLRARAFSPATVRAYAFDVANLARFLEEHKIGLGVWSRWTSSPGSTGRARGHPQQAGSSSASGRVLRHQPRSTAGSPRSGPSSRSLVMRSHREANPVPAPRRGQGLRPTARHARPSRSGPCSRRRAAGPRKPPTPRITGPGRRPGLPCRAANPSDRAMVLAMLLGGLRSVEVRGLLLTDVDQG